MKELIIQKKAAIPAVLQVGYESLAPATQEAYTRDLNTFYKEIGKDLTAATPLDVQNYIKILESKGLKNSTINRKIYALSKVFSLYKAAGIVEKNPVTTLNAVKRISRTVSRQIDNQVNITDLQSIAANNGKAATIIKVLANTGLRVSELINIQHTAAEDYHAGRNKYKRIRIVGKGNKERFIYLSGKLYKEILLQYPQNGNYLFHKDSTPLNRVTVFRQIKKEFMRCTGKDIHPHSLRHFFATHKINQEKQDIKAVSKYLGHSGTSITLDMYVDTALSAEQSMIRI